MRNGCCRMVRYIVILLTLRSLATQIPPDRPSPQMLADLYNHAPNLIKAAMQNVGLLNHPFPVLYPIQSQPSQIQPSRPNLTPSASNHHYIVVPPPPNAGPPQKSSSSRVIFPVDVHVQAPPLPTPAASSSENNADFRPALKKPEQPARNNQNVGYEPFRTVPPSTTTIAPVYIHKDQEDSNSGRPNFQNPRYEYGFKPLSLETTNFLGIAPVGNKPHITEVNNYLAPRKPEEALPLLSKPNNTRNSPNVFSLLSGFGLNNPRIIPYRLLKAHKTKLEAAEKAALVSSGSSNGETNENLASPKAPSPVPRAQPLIKKPLPPGLAYDCKGGKDLGWCELGERYPKEEVDHIYIECQDAVERMYVEIPDHNSEEGFSGSNKTHGRGRQIGWSWADYSKQTLCQTDDRYVLPSFAQDTFGKWMVVVQTKDIVQRVPVTLCRNPDKPCSRVSDCGIKSKCSQVFSYQQLISINPAKPEDCPRMKLFKFPSACICQVDALAYNIHF